MRRQFHRSIANCALLSSALTTTHSRTAFSTTKAFLSPQTPPSQEQQTNKSQTKIETTEESQNAKKTDVDILGELFSNPDYIRNLMLRTTAKFRETCSWKDLSDETLFSYFAASLRMYFFPNNNDVPTAVRNAVQVQGIMVGQEFPGSIASILSVILIDDMSFGTGKTSVVEQQRLMKYELSLLIMACRRESELLHLLANPRPTKRTFDGPLFDVPLKAPVWTVVEKLQVQCEEDGKKQSMSLFPFGKTSILPIFTFRKKGDEDESLSNAAQHALSLSECASFIKVHCYLKKDDIPTMSVTKSNGDVVKIEPPTTFVWKEISLFQN